MEYEYDRSRYFEIPKYFYFEVKNSSSGSINTFNYLITPTDESLHVKIWYGLLCSELSEAAAEEDFEKSQEGYRRMVYWVDEQFEVYKEKLAAGEIESRRTFSGEL